MHLSWIYGQNDKITYASISILVSPSSNICWSFLAILDHILDTGIHSVFRYWIKLGGTRGSVEISPQIFENPAGSLVLTQICTFSQSSLKALITKWWCMAQSCHVCKNTQLCRYMSPITVSWAWLWLDMIIDGRTSGLASLTQLRKNAMVSFLIDNVMLTRTSYLTFLCSKDVWVILLVSVSILIPLRDNCHGRCILLSLIFYSERHVTVGYFTWCE